ncbi:MAG: protein kinase [Acidobacteria bacterium]|nr:protein kinase [Acidobacteriota bacterium]
MPAAGDFLGPYKLLSPIGAGGMGQVWRALDDRLGRAVAVKILPDGSGGDLRQRFELEARAASALQHPNIVSVFDVGTAGDTPYIVSELVEGDTLRVLLQRGPLPLRRALELASQVAGGMAAAHQAGITHRDLKPENIMIATDGRAKILDFGLAKRAAVTAAAKVDNSTDTYISHPGAILGTANYMSPEQARGLAVDWRSDQFSFGIVLYEILTGQQPFKRDSAPQTLAAIIADDPPSLPNSLPAPLRWVVERCLDKEPSQRYGSTADLHRDLRHMREHLTDLSAQSTTVAAPRARVPWLGAGLAGVVLGAALLLLIRGGADEVDPVDLIPFATEPEGETSPAFSPDGQSIAYFKSPNQIWVRALNNPNAILLADGAVGGPIWSRDGNRVCYKGGRAFWCVSAAGGLPRKILDDAGFGAPQFTPDGNSLLMVHPVPDKPAELWISSPVGSEPKPVPGMKLPPRVDTLEPFSPDGKKLAIHTFTQEIWIAPYPSGAARRVETARGAAFSWFPDSRHAVISAEREGFQAIYLIDTESNAERLLLRGSTQLAAASLSPDGERLVYSTGLADWDAVEYGIDGKSIQPLVATTSRELYPTWSPTEERFAYVSFASRNPTIWTRANDGTAPVLLREVAGVPFGPYSPTYSPDGRRIAYWIPQELQTIPSSGGQHVKVANVRAPVNNICWSADGETIWFTQPGHLMKVASLGGEPVAVREIRGQQVDCAPDGRWIAYPNEKGLHLMTPEGKEDHILIPGPLLNGRVQFGEGSRVLYQLETEKRELVSWDVASGQKIRSVSLQLPPGDMVNRFNVHRDGKRVLLQAGRIAYDLWIAEGFAQPAPLWRRWVRHWIVPSKPVPARPESQ